MSIKNLFLQATAAVGLAVGLSNCAPETTQGSDNLATDMLIRDRKLDSLIAVRNASNNDTGSFTLDNIEPASKNNPCENKFVADYHRWGGPYTAGDDSLSVEFTDTEIADHKPQQSEIRRIILTNHMADNVSRVTIYEEKDYPFTKEGGYMCYTAWGNQSSGGDVLRQTYIPKNAAKNLTTSGLNL